MYVTQQKAHGYIYSSARIIIIPSAIRSTYNYKYHKFFSDSPTSNSRLFIDIIVEFFEISIIGNIRIIISD